MIRKILSEVWVVYLDGLEYNRYVALEEAENKVAELIKKGYKSWVEKEIVKKIKINFGVLSGTGK